MRGKRSQPPGGAGGGPVSFRELLWDALKPSPGRGRITLRLAIVCTVVVLISNTFRLPMQDLLPLFILFVTKEEKVTTTISVVLVLVAITLAIGASILLFKCTGNRPEFRIPGIAAEIFVGMYLFRVLAIGAVGWILGFVCAASQSLVYRFPDPEETVHQFLWLWVAVALSAGLAWLANLLLFPISPAQLLQHKFVAGWHAVGAATEQLAANSPVAGARLLGPPAKRGPSLFLKLLKLSSLEVPALKMQQGQLTRVILALDKITKLLFSYTRARLRSPGPVAASSAETALLGELRESAQRFEREFEAGLAVPPGAGMRSARAPGAGSPAFQLVEAANTLEDLGAANIEPEKQPAGAGARQKPSLFVADAFSNPRHVQFALKVTLAGMIGYLFYTASDYYGIHTVFYTPLIIALASTGATIHKAVLRITGCVIGGILGLICTVWLIPRYESLGTFLLIIFCLHALAAWIASGSEKISYIGLQVALVFDLGVLQGYGPPTKIDPMRDRFIGIVLGVCILSVVFSLIWPESAASLARERLAACLRAIARLLRLGRSNDGSPSPATLQRAQVELEIASRLSEAHAYEEQARFEALLYGSGITDEARLEEVTTGVEEFYVACLPWVREQASLGSNAQGVEHRKAAREMTERFAGAVEGFADLMEAPRPRHPSASRLPLPADRLPETKEGDIRAGPDFDSRKALCRTLVQLQDQVLPAAGCT